MADCGSLHIVVFPWLAFGHMIPFLELSKALARRGHRISFISTPRNLQRLPKLPPEISHLIDFIPFTLPEVEGLPENAEATSDLRPDEHPFLLKALDGLEQPFSEFIKQASPKPDWIVQDLFQLWIPDAAAAAGVPCATFIVLPAAAMSFIGPMTSKDTRTALEDFTKAPPWVPFPSKVVYRAYELRKDYMAWKWLELEGVPDCAQRYKKTIGGCSVLAPRSCKELECEYLKLLEEIFEKPVVPVGPLLPSVKERSEDHNDAAEALMEWLDNQKSTSVVYVALGSEAVMSIDLLRELALGLEAAKLPFIWALRRDAEMLPEGFEVRTRGFGIVVKGWVPQLKILAHGAVGAFLTHCGWGSIIEGAQSGRPLVMLPVALEQGLTARSMEERGIGIEVKRNKEDGSFTREDVVEALNLVMAEDGEGEIYRKRGEEMKEALGNKECHEKYVDDFVQYLVTHRS